MPKGGWREFDDQSTSRPLQARSPFLKAELNVRVQKTRGGKGGKTVTVITGLQLGQDQARTLLKKLKAMLPYFFLHHHRYFFLYHFHFLTSQRDHLLSEMP